MTHAICISCRSGDIYVAGHQQTKDRGLIDTGPNLLTMLIFFAHRLKSHHSYRIHTQGRYCKANTDVGRTGKIGSSEPSRPYIYYTPALLRKSASQNTIIKNNVPILQLTLLSKCYYNVPEAQTIVAAIHTRAWQSCSRTKDTASHSQCLFVGAA